MIMRRLEEFGYGVHRKCTMPQNIIHSCLLSAKAFLKISVTLFSGVCQMSKREDLKAADRDKSRKYC